MSAIREDLLIEFLLEAFRRRFDMARLPGNTQRRIAQRDDGLETRDAATAIAGGVAEIADLTQQAPQITPIKAHIRVLQNQRRLAEPGDDTARQHVRTPSDRMTGSLQRYPLVDQRARISAGDPGFSGTQMAKPAEAQQSRGPFVGRRLHFENRAPIAKHHFPGKGEASGINFRGAGRVGRAQVLRRDQKAIGLERRHRPAKQWMAIGATDDAPERATKQKPRQLRVVANSNARHRLRSPSLRFSGATITKRWRAGQSRHKPLQLMVFYQSSGVETIDPGKPRIGIRQLARQGAQVAVFADELHTAENLGGLNGRAP